MKIPLNWIAAAALAALLAGCATTVEYGDATSSKPISTSFGSSDLQQIAATMVDSMLADEVLQDISQAGPPLLIVDKVKNKTMQHIDTESVTDSIRTKLIRSRKFSFQDRTTEAALQEELPDITRRQAMDALSRYGIFQRQSQDEIEKLRASENVALPADLDYATISGLSKEIQHKLGQARPQTLGQASRIPGVTPAAVSLLMIHLKKRSAGQQLEQSA